jgi:hypothetical protein
VDVYPFAFDKKFAALLGVTGIRPETTRVEVTDDRLVVTFGRWGVDTPLANISCLKVTSGYRWYRAVGLRGSMVDGGVTFGTNADRGLCILFHERVPPVLPVLGAHPGLTVTVADVDGLEATLRRRLDLA